MNALSAQSADALLGSTALSPAGTDAELIAACARFCELERAWVAAGDGNIEIDSAEETACTAERERIDEMKDPLEDRILDLPCITLPGFRAVADAIATWDRELLKDGHGDIGQCLTSKLVSALLAPSPSVADAQLLALCARLRLLAEEWQRLWTACPEVEEEEGPQVEALEAYSENVWPGFANQVDPERDPMGQLAILPAHTAEGRQARAAAVYAIEMAERYTDGQREDFGRMMLLVIREAAGDALIKIGESGR